MSVAAMTLDDQRLNSYGKMPKQYEQTGVAGVESPDSPQYHHHHHHHIQQQQQQQQHIQDPPQIQLQPQQQEQQNAEQRMLEEENENLKAEQGRLMQQCADTQRREKILTRRLANKEQEFQDYVSQIAEYKAAQVPSAMALRSALLDPAVNLIFEKLKKELKATKAKLEETQNELSAWKFTPDSNTGKRLMAKCRLLYQENEELGKMTSSGRLAKLETELAMQKSFSEEVKKSQSELDDFLQELDEDVEGMQSTILFLQQELKTTRERIQVLEKENYQLKNGLLEGDTLISGASGGDHMLSKNINNEVNDNEINAEHVQHATGLNGNSMTISKGNTNVDNGTIECYQQQQQLHEQNEISFQAGGVSTTKATPLTLTPIKEEPCVRVSAYTCGTDYYNGSADDDQHRNLATIQHNTDDGASGSRLLRTTARKRAYDNMECNDIITNDTTAIPTMPVQQVTHVAPTPRTLPPKKSKLRMTPPIVTPQPSSMESNENENATVAGIGVGIGVGIGSSVPSSINSTTTQEHSMMLENSNVSVVVTNEDSHILTSTEECPNTGVAQRIMTRRRSMRTQQNGV